MDRFISLLNNRLKGLSLPVIDGTDEPNVTLRLPRGITGLEAIDTELRKAGFYLEERPIKLDILLLE